MERKVKTAIVGCGTIRNIHIKNLKYLFSIIDLVALGDRISTVAEEKARIYSIPRVMTILMLVGIPLLIRFRGQVLTCIDMC